MCCSTHLQAHLWRSLFMTAFCLFLTSLLLCQRKWVIMLLNWPKLSALSAIISMHRQSGPIPSLLHLANRDGDGRHDVTLCMNEHTHLSDILPSYLSPCSGLNQMHLGFITRWDTSVRIYKTAQIKCPGQFLLFKEVSYKLDNI